MQTSDSENDECPLIIDELPNLKGKISTPFDEHTEQFMEYLMGRSGGGKNDTTARNIQQDVLKYFNYTVHVHPQHQSLPYKDIILNKNYLHEYFNYLEMHIGLQPSTMMNKLQKLIVAMEYVEFVENQDGTNAQIHSQCEAMIGVLNKWKKSLYRPRSKQRSHQYEVSTAKVAIYVHFMHALIIIFFFKACMLILHLI